MKSFEDYANQLIALDLLSNDDTLVYYQRAHLEKFDDSSLNIFGMLGNMLPFSMYTLLLYDKENSQSLYYKLFIFAVILSNTFLSIALSYRIAMFLLIMIVVIIPNTFYRMVSYKKFYLLLLNFFMIIWYIYQLYKANITGIGLADTVPYHF